MAAGSVASRLARGAIVKIELPSLIPTAIAFQYNPETLTRTLRPRTTAGDGDRAEALRLTGAPVETIRLEAELDALDQREPGGAEGPFGIYPQLSALEILTYPQSSRIIANAVLAATGSVEMVPAMGPLTLFVWGLQRIVPVRLEELSITEEAFDAELNPIRARISLGMRVLSYDDLHSTHPGYTVFMAHQLFKEAMAAVGTVTTVRSILGDNISIV